MEITVRRKDLAKELQLVQGIVERKSSIPVLSNVLAEAEEGQLRLSATDLDVSLRGGCEAEVKQPGAVTVAAKKLHEIVRTLPEDEVHIKMLPDAWVQIECQRARFKVAGLPREDFPALPEAKGKGGIELPTAALADLIARTGFAITSEETRYYLAGALLVLKPDAMALVATDGHRLAYAERKVKVAGVKQQQKVLVPRKALTELGRLLEADETVTYREIENHLVFSVGGRTLASKSIEGQFPGYENVVDWNGDKRIILERDALQTALRRVSLLSSERSRAVRVKLSKGELELLASSPDLGEAREVIPVEYAGDGMEIGFNAQYLLEFLAVAGGEQVGLLLKDSESQGLLRPEGLAEGDDYRYVVMPMRL